MGFNGISRRKFVKIALLAPFAWQLEAKEHIPKKDISLKEALYYKTYDERAKTVSCQLCPRGCIIGEGELGFCRARRNIKGRLYSLGYSRPCAVHIDPIEKKPFFNVLPRTLSFSIASAGCNLRCRFCQNWQISQASPEDTVNEYMPPEKVVEMAEKNRCRSIAYTYTEPTNFFEYMIDVARIAKKRGILNIQHSNGYINPEPLRELCRYLDAANIDLKGFNNAFYNRYCEADLKPVLETIKALKKSGVWVEITNLVIGGHNDDPSMIGTMCEWIKKEVGPDVPIHFSRFFPMYRMRNIAPTPVGTLEKARDTAIKAGIQYVYIGNVPGNPGENTYCPHCKKAVIKRVGYSIMDVHIKNGKCSYCGEKIGGIWDT
ncbi:MAG TPA: AmmeMemoRadiSam system radical SAM enzyme [Syntrophorhabdaceae bacterium]|nr:AmmeMemoRadiSam system radical SAM enzyme [Syntrophorhabdaceae bacterium]HQE79577.1 AmmeMemoRadiSam system radical SAM enzyme [Syntrophorhabdaceae bacterium]